MGTIVKWEGGGTPGKFPYRPQQHRTEIFQVALIRGGARPCGGGVSPGKWVATTSATSRLG